MANGIVSRTRITKLVTLCVIGAVVIIVALFHAGVFGPRVEIETVEGAAVSGEQSIGIARQMASEEGIDKESLVGKRIWDPDKIAVSVIYELPLLSPVYEFPDAVDEPIYEVSFERRGHFVQMYVSADSAEYYGMRLCR